MGTQEYRANYRAALHVANSDLNDIYREYEQVQLRKEMIENAVAALEPFLQSSAEVSPEAYRAEPVPVPEPRYEVLVPVAAEPQYEPQLRERIAPASFAPVPDIIVDPIQNRINRALGLAVA
jgi:hypothetical protein